MVCVHLAVWYIPSDFLLQSSPLLYSLMHPGSVRPSIEVHYLSDELV